MNNLKQKLLDLWLAYIHTTEHLYAPFHQDQSAEKRIHSNHIIKKNTQNAICFGEWFSVRHANFISTFNILLHEI